MPFTREKGRLVNASHLMHLEFLSYSVRVVELHVLCSPW